MHLSTYLINYLHIIQLCTIKMCKIIKSFINRQKVGYKIKKDKYNVIYYYLQYYVTV